MSSTFEVRHKAAVCRQHNFHDRFLLRADSRHQHGRQSYGPTTKTCLEALQPSVEQFRQAAFAHVIMMVGVGTDTVVALMIPRGSVDK
jgi:hypothetical protein